MITYHVEKLADILDEMKPMFIEHWNEIALFKEHISLDPDYNKYLEMEAAGLIHVTTARDDGLLIGYMVVFVVWHLHYRQSKTVVSDIYFLRPQYRRGRIGVKLFQNAEKAWKQDGVQVAYVGAKISNDVTKVWERLGYNVVENKMGKLL